MVDMEVPSGYVEFLKSLLPNKPAAEIYTMLGLQKHGKTLFYRDFLHHLRHSSDDFVIAPGIRGLVMLVFTLPSYPVRVQGDQGRHLPAEGHRPQAGEGKVPAGEVPRSRGTHGGYAGIQGRGISERSICTRGAGASCSALAPTVIEEEGDTLIVKHVYIERRMVPLNMHLDGADDEQVRHAIREYGDAIKQMAAANIFPGDMLFKNFGVTRFGRVVFYDYDEIAYMTDCMFRRMPAPRTPEDEMSAEPWYPVGPNDVFPEEFAAFLLGDPQVRKCFPRTPRRPARCRLLERDRSSASPPDISKTCFPIPEALRFRNRFARRTRKPELEFDALLY